ncbi:mechanosensitive ion channel [Verrucomicrobiaceae bacterium N1E253]|uniref:Mechanosensitive ion channel n=1 Tax=Oceaniferula marina TaxID=2748318 RepID=A0A851GII6_9BACT|nr:mechanosensitive ion channel domain-containing protein [Oceaniferula marina]NWK54440.1 mechanosensitive ion channel [Oceaniferula marina]
MNPWESIRSSIANNVSDYWQWGTMILCFAAALILTRIIYKALFHEKASFRKFCSHFFNTGEKINGTPLVFSALLWITLAVRNHWSQTLIEKGGEGIQSNYIHTVALIVSGYVVYQVAHAVSKGQLIPRILSGCMLAIFIFHLLGWLTPLNEALQDIELPVGDLNVNLWNIFSSLASLVILLWIVSLANRFVDAAIFAQKEIPPTIKVLISKSSRFFLYGFALIAALSIGGVPLGGLTVFSGALGLGLGFGLQKIIANMISGLIILVDKSIKPGDVIEMDGTFGSINSIHSRYVSVITRDRKEFLIPNEDFVTNKVINWSYSDRVIRVKADIGVSYDTDLNLAIRLCTDAAQSVSRVIKSPAPVCLLREFGDSAIILQIRFCIEDAVNGVSNVRSQVLLAIWQSFRDNHIEIPFPQRDLHIKSGTLPYSADPKATLPPVATAPDTQ